MKKGDRFEHKTWLSPISYTGKIPQVFEVTRITKTRVYYRPVYKHGEREELGSGFWSDPNKFDEYVLKWIN